MKTQIQKLRTVSRSFKKFAVSALGTAVFLNLVNMACVTVNVNFPESAVQKATDDFVKDLYRSKEHGKKSGGTTWRFPSLINEASAASEASAVFKIDSEKSEEIKSRFAKRVDEIIALKRRGVLGETNDGKLAIKDPTALKKLEIRKVDQLVSDENRDRSALYEEVLKSNGMQQNRMKDLTNNFTRSFQAESPSGTWVMDPTGKWEQKP